LKSRTAILLLLMCAWCSILSAQVTNRDLLAGPGQNWLTYLGDYAAKRYSPLKEINTSTVSRLVPKWVRHFENTSDLEVTPLVYDGVMYTTNGNEIYALDATTGREVWHYRAAETARRGVNRGPAILGDQVFLTTADCHLVALRRNNGAILWEKEFASRAEGYSCSGAPLAVKNKIIVGVASSGKTCFVAALSAGNGKEVWRVWAVPHEGEQGSETWGKFPLSQGGGPTWTTGAYDPELNLLYWPTGNPWPDFYGGDRPGDNLYTDSVLALDADTGKMKWYFQFVPHDTHDWDANETPVLVDAEFQAKQRKLLIQANRNGFYYVLDRATGEFLLGKPFVKELNWAKGLNAKGRPVTLPKTEPSPAGTRVCPSVHGATNWWAPSLNPDLGLFYVVALEQCEIYYSSTQKPVPNSGFRGTGHNIIPGEPGQFYLRAIDLRTGKICWEFPMPGPTTMWAGTVATAGGLVFSADDDGDLIAFDAKTGKALWHFYMGSNLHASPMTFSVDHRQYITIASGTNLFTFSLSGIE
jgi:alcohol dehydrogenase (cytochrome c)